MLQCVVLRPDSKSGFPIDVDILDSNVQILKRYVPRFAESLVDNAKVLPKRRLRA